MFIIPDLTKLFFLFSVKIELKCVLHPKSQRRGVIIQKVNLAKCHFNEIEHN